MADDFDVKVGKNVRACREAAGMSQTDLAEALSRATGEPMYQQTVLKIEKGTRPLKFAEAQHIANVFKVPVTALTEQSAPEADVYLTSKITDVMLRHGDLDMTAYKLGEALVNLALAVGANKGTHDHDQASPGLVADAETVLGTQWGENFSKSLLSAIVTELQTARLMFESEPQTQVKSPRPKDIAGALEQAVSLAADLDYELRLP